MEDPSKNPADRLITALKERNITVKRGEIEPALNDATSKAENTKWIAEHLSYDTLLTREELELYSSLEKSGTLQHILHDPNIASTRPLLDDDLQNAIDSLKASTAAIQKQTEILTTQCETLNNQLHRDDDRTRGQDRGMTQLRKKHEAGRQTVKAESNDLVDELEAHLKSETEKARVDGRRVLSSLTTRLKEDDRILTGLEKLASGINSSGDDATVAKRTEQLGAMLAEYVAEEIHYRLDRMYLESVLAAGQATSGPGPGPGPGQSQPTGEEESNEHEQEELVALGEELESLYPEIDVLAEMSTKQQFSEPILRELQNRHGQLRNASHGKLEYVLDTIMEMTSSTENLTTRLQERESYSQTLESLMAAYRTQIGDPYSEKTSSSSSSRRDTTTFKRRSLPPFLNSPEKLQSSDPESQSLASLLRRLGISSDFVFKSEEEDGGANALYDKRSQIQDYFRTLGVGADLPLVTELTPTDRAARLLSSALEADSSFAHSLSDVEQDQRLSELEAQLGLVQTGANKLNTDVLYQRDKDQERFLERWAS